MDDNAATIENIQQTFPIKPNYVVRNAEKSASEDTSKDFESLEEIEQYIEQQGKQIEIKGKESSGFTLIISPGVFLPLKISVEIPDSSEANIFELFTGPASTIALQRIDLLLQIQELYRKTRNWQLIPFLQEALLLRQITFLKLSGRGEC